MGGYVAMSMQRQYPERISGLILCSTRGGPETDAKARDEAMRLARDGGVKAIVEKMLPKMFAPGSLSKKEAVVRTLEQVMLKTSLEGVLGDLVAMRDPPDARPQLPGLDVPTLVIHGKDDQLIPCSEGEALASAIRGASLNVMADCGHLPPSEQPQAFNAAVRSFVKLIGPSDEDTAH